MPRLVELTPTPCAICGTMENAAEVYPANFSLEALNPEIFSARRLPDRVHYRLVRCRTCGLVRSDPVASADVLAELYAQSEFNYGTEVKNLQSTYGRYLSKLDAFGARKDALLEIGAGNGFFLEEAQRRGYANVRGVEPSKDAIARAPASLQGRIVCDMMRPGLFPAAEFDVICLMQVFDHIPCPRELLTECLRVLRPGGLILFLQHHVEALSARIMGEKSPIVDIEHTYLYTPETLSRILKLTGFEVVHAGSAWNTYSLQYLSRLVPLPKGLKRGVLSALEKTGVGRITLRVPLGNQWVVGRKSQA